MFRSAQKLSQNNVAAAYGITTFDLHRYTTAEGRNEN
jgi:hypothetical protein